MVIATFEGCCRNAVRRAKQRKREAERKRKLRGSFRRSLSRRNLRSLVRAEEVAAGDDVGVEMVDLSEKKSKDDNDDDGDREDLAVAKCVAVACVFACLRG